MENLNEKNVPTSPEKWAQAKAQAKAKFDVYPSAYANGWAAKKYKEMGGGWKSVSEAVKDKFDIGEYDQEGDMDKSDLRSIIANAQKMHDMLDDADNLPEWVQSKITKAEDYISTVANYMTAEMNEEWSKTGKEATHRETGEKTYEYHEVDNDGKPTGKREYRNAQGKPMGEEFAGWVAHYNGQKHEIQKHQAKDLYDAKKKAIEHFKVPKHKQGLLAVKPGYNESIEEGYYKDIDTDRKETERLSSKPPFDPPYSKVKGTVTDKSGAKHTPMSRARDLARQAVKKQSEYAKARNAGSSTKNAQARAAGAANPHMFESRKAQIVKEIVKGKKKETPEKFQSDPVVTDITTKSQTM
jgi:hypothetical protein